jgi:protein-ribulosamine 3-kinase
VPQLQLARSKGFLVHDTMDRLVDVIPDALADVETGGLLHGDLWSGNAYATEAGTPVIGDPAVFRGHGEVDLAMTELFGGFGQRFYEAYNAILPISREYEAFRRDLYQLYYLLVHLNLFGGSYESSSLAAASRTLTALG